MPLGNCTLDVPMFLRRQSALVLAGPQHPPTQLGKLGGFIDCASNRLSRTRNSGVVAAIR